MQIEESRQFAALFIRWSGTNADAAQIAKALATLWQEIDDALSPILGQRGVTALYKRSLHRTPQPWLSAVANADNLDTDLDVLQAAVVRQSAADATEGSTELLNIFYQLLCSLIGPSLTERLLRSVCASSLNGTPVQDNMS